MPFSTPAKNLMLDALAPNIAALSLHTADPGSTGANEVAGGSPAYARVASPGFLAAAAGVLSMIDPATWNVLSSTVTHVGMWSAGGAWLGSGQLPTPAAVSGQSTLTITNIRPQITG